MKPIHILTIVGARPQYIKAAMVSPAIVEYNRLGKSPAILEDIIHTGQHYDENMSDIFFKQMHMPGPVVNLQAGAGMHGEMTGRMLAQIEKEITQRKPDRVLADLTEVQIGTMVCYSVPVHRLEHCADNYSQSSNRVVGHASTKALSLPLWPELPCEDQVRIAQALR